MSSLDKRKIKIALQKLSEFMANPSNEFTDVINSSFHNNGWFTVEEVQRSLVSLSKMLNTNDLDTWLTDVKLSQNPKKV